MLILTHRKDGQIQIGENIVITVVEILKHKVRIGIDAPKEIPIVRADAINKQRKEADAA